MKKIILLSILLLSSWALNAQNNLTMLGHLAYPTNTCAGIWQYVDSLGNEYALVGVNDRIAIVDVTNAANPVEVFAVPALANQSSLWRELKTYGKYAYAVSEGGGGLIIIDLSGLPGTVSSKHWYGDGIIANQLSSAHTIAVADGFAYIFGTGSGLANGGAVIVDLTDPWNPTYVGQYNLNYIHDGYIRNDTLWAGEIYSGQFSVIDVSNKANPVLLATQATPGAFCHNTWLSDNSSFLFTTDEQNFAPLGAFDVSNISNISLVDEYFTDSMPSEEVHNVRVLNDFLINPSYGSQLTICDAARPDNIVEIASYPTGSFLCWDASPYLPSGHIIVADVDGGVYVFEPNYVRACYLEGNVTDSITGLPLNNVKISILNSGKTKYSSITGAYKMGTPTAGTYDIEFRKPGYKTKVFSGVNLINGQLTIINALMEPYVLSGTVFNNSNSQGIGGASLTIFDGSSTVSITADQNGNFTLNNISSGNLEITATHWGYISFCQTVFNDGTTPLNIGLDAGYYDDFTTDFGWTVTSTATSGTWVRGVPVGTTYGAIMANPGEDSQTDCGHSAFVTGNNGGTANTDDVDNGYTELISPVFDLSSYSNPFISYEWWFSCLATLPLASQDTMFISLTNGSTTVVIDTITLNSPGLASWVPQSLRIANFMTPGPNMQLHVIISDGVTTGNILEGGFDHFRIQNGLQSVDDIEKNSAFLLFPNPGNGQFCLKFNKARTPGANLELSISDYTGRWVMSHKVSENESSVYGSSELTPGIYLVSIIENGVITGTQKLIKSK